MKEIFKIVLAVIGLGLSILVCVWSSINLYNMGWSYFIIGLAFIIFIFINMKKITEDVEK